MTAVAVDPRLRERRHAVSAAEQQRRLRRLIALAVVVVLALAAWGVSRSSLLDVDEVRWSGLERVDLVEASAIAGITAGEPISSVDAGAIERRLEELPWIRSATVDRSWSGAVTIDVVERVPVAQVMRTQGEWVLVDEHGVVLSDEVTTSVLPRLSGLAAAGAAGSQLSPHADAMLQVAMMMPAELVDRFEGVSRDPRGEMWITLTTGDRVLLGDADQLLIKILSMATVLEDLDAEGRVGFELDVTVPTLAVVRDLRPEWQSQPLDATAPDEAVDAGTGAAVATPTDG